MIDYCDLEMTIRRQDTNYSVDFLFSDNDASNQVDMGAGLRADILAAFNLSAFDDYIARGDMKGYGNELTKQLFADLSLQREFAKIRSAVETQAKRLRFRLKLHASAMELYRLRWETLGDPESGLTFATDQNVYFSRYFLTSNLKPIRARPKGQLKALIMVAAPEGLSAYPGLVDVPRKAEEEAASASLGDIASATLEKATLSGLVQALTADEYDLLYLVAHGAFIKDKGAHVLLEDEDGKVARVPAADFVQALSGLERPPRLIVLASCQSAGNGSGDVLSALGPSLAEAGIPAVLAMQDTIAIETNAKFMPFFFKELQKDGQIDRALNVARSQVREQSDFWVPVLFMRLKDGRLWAVSSEQLASQGAEGIRATAAILQRSAEAFSRTIQSFETASEQIGRMTDYKHLHDLLHRLQFEIYAPASSHVAHFPDDVDAADELFVYAEKLDTMVKDLNELLARPTINTREKNLAREFEAALRDFKQALAANDATVLRKCFSSLKRVIATRPTVVNGVLTEAARALQLDVLGDALSRISKDAPEESLDAPYMGQIHDGADAILALDRSLTTLVNEHDAWQDVSIDLRDFEDDPKRFDESQSEELGFRWSDLKDKAQPLYLDRPEDWAAKMRDAATALDAGLAAGNPTDSRRAFRKFSTVAGDRFFKVDCNLKDLCDDIAKISEPLQKVMESVGRTDK
ncbi:MAG: CHAT domain-containing protein [Bacteroidota bacterium]